MVTCLVDDTPQSIDSGLKTWGELLHALDAEAAAVGRTVTGVRFDGVDQPTFRGRGIEQVPLSVVEAIEVDTADPRRLLQSALATACLSLPTLATSAGRLAASYREGRIEQRGEHWSGFVNTLRTLTELTRVAAAAAGTDLERLDCGGESGADRLGAVGVALAVVSRGQDEENWAAVADGLEHDLVPALLDWGTVFEALQDRCAA